MKRYNFVDHSKVGHNALHFFDAVGDDVAYRVMQAVGGIKVTVPKKPSDTCYLSHHITAEDLAVLCQHYAGERLNVPKFDRIAKQIRNARIRARRKDGWTVSSIALQFALCERSVYFIVKDADDVPEDETFDAYGGDQLF